MLLAQERARLAAHILMALMLAAALLTVISTSVRAAAVELDNPGFEDGFNGWVESDPAAISGDVRSGSGSAKLEGATARLEQTVAVSPNTDYELSAYILGVGEIGVEIDGSESSTSGGDGDDFAEVTHSFNSGSATSVVIFAAYGGDTGRFDDFALESGDTVGGCSDVTPVDASDDGTNDGNVPAGAIDGNLDPDSRWSSNGDSKSIEFDLGSNEDIAGVSVAWYKGDERQAYFAVETSTDGSSWSSAIDGGVASGTTTAMEDYTFSERSARYIRVTQNGNSSGNGWNSIVEFTATVCDGTTTTTTTPTTTTPTTTTPPGDNQFDPDVWDDSEAGDYIESEDPWVLSFDGMDQFTATPNGNGPRDELKTPIDDRVGSDETYETFSADITFNLDDGVKLIAHQIHGDDPTLVKLYVQDSSPLGIFKGEGEDDWSIGDYPLLEGVANNGVFDVFLRVRIPGFESGDGEPNEDLFDLGTIQSGDTISYEFINDYGVITVNSQVGGNSVSFDYDIHDTDNAYMKFGSYVQAQDAATGCNYDDSDDGVVDCTDWAGPFDSWEDFFNNVGISSAEVIFSNVVHEGGPLQ